MKKRAFVVMPFGDPVARHAYECCVKKLCAEFDVEVRAADEIFSTNPIYEDIVAEIQGAVTVIADVSGLNPNVMYELGIAHTLKQKQTIIITHDTYEKAPFDIAHFRIVQYEDSIEGARQFEEQFRRTLETVLQDLKEVYREQFKLIVDVLVKNSNQPDLILLMGFAQYHGVVRLMDRVEGWGWECGDGPIEERCFQMSASAESFAELFVKMKYIETKEGMILLTELGRAFVDSLKEQGFVAGRFNDQDYETGVATPQEIQEHYEAKGRASRSNPEAKKRTRG